MTYNRVDIILQDFAAGAGVSVQYEDGPVKRRFFYISSKDGDTFQIVVEPENDEFVRVDAHLIENFTNAELHYVWEVSLDELRTVLNVVLKSVEIWFNRS